MQASSTSFGIQNQQFLNSFPHYIFPHNLKPQFNFIGFPPFQNETPILRYDPSPSEFPLSPSLSLPCKQEEAFNFVNITIPISENLHETSINVKNEPSILAKYEDDSNTMYNSPLTQQPKIEVKAEDDLLPSSFLHPNSRKISKMKHEPLSPETKSHQPSQPHKKIKAKKKTRHTWSPEEDAQLLELLKKHGKKWAKVASFMKSRNGKQVRDHYLNALAPDINRGVWTEAEDKSIIFYYKKYGAQWCKIAESVGGRTETQVKGRFYTNLKQKLLMKNVKVEIVANKSIKEEEEEF